MLPGNGCVRTGSRIEAEAGTGDLSRDASTEGISIVDGRLPDVGTPALRFTMVSARGHSVCGVSEDRTVWCWGDNGWGQLGDGTTQLRTVPVHVKGPGRADNLTGVRQVAVSGHQTVDTHGHACAVLVDDTIFCWGQNSSGQLGIGTRVAYQLTPVQVMGPGGIGFLTGVASVATSLAHKETCAVKNDGTAWCWGADNTLPVQVVGPNGVGSLTGVRSISMCQATTCALKNDDTVWCWGENDAGQLGNGTTTDSATPVQVVGPLKVGFLTGVKSVAVSTDHACAARKDGTAWCWGRNVVGSLGSGTWDTGEAPLQVRVVETLAPITDVTAVSTGWSGHSLALKADGTLWCWGANYANECGVTAPDHFNTARPVSGGFTDWKWVQGGAQHACGVRSDGSVWCWGDAAGGKLGNGTTSPAQPRPVQVLGMAEAPAN